MSFTFVSVSAHTMRLERRVACATSAWSDMCANDHVIVASSNDVSFGAGVFSREGEQLAVIETEEPIGSCALSTRHLMLGAGDGLLCLLVRILGMRQRRRKVCPRHTWSVSVMV